MVLRAGILGATGYTGFELVKLLSRHPTVTIDYATSESQAGKTLDQVFPAAPALPLVMAADVDYRQLDVVFLCLPHAAAAPTAVTALAHGARVIDLSADFRLQDAAVYAHWYQHEHPAPHLLAQAVYGLTELARPALRQASLVANPGCYPTAVLLGLRPLLQAQMVTGTIIADAKSGVSGAGRAPKQHTHFVEVAGNFSAYNIGRKHRHLPEMEQAIAGWSHSPEPPALIFSPHLLPVPRGILATIYAPVAPGRQEDELRALYTDCYAGEPFVQLLPPGELASLAHVTYSNRCAIGLTLAHNTLIITSAIDNLVKGAAGQAVQNMNVMFGLAETAGLV
jgi:N-acetyl-gamma-glutamyl-phosphate reductase